MKSVFSVIQKVVPEINELFAQRLTLIRLLSKEEKRIGRKALADLLNVTERSIRTTIQSMRQQSIVDVNHQGIKLTQSGFELLDAIDQLVLVEESDQFYELEQKVKEKLNISHCKVVPGNVSVDSDVFTLLSQQVQAIIDDELGNGSYVVAVTGGSTLAQIGQYFTTQLTRHRNLTFVPTRGGFGGTVEIQSNNVGGIMSQKTNSKYIPLFVPENLDENMSRILLQDPSVKKAVDISKQADCLLLSIGTADVMAKRRAITDEQMKKIEEKQAIGEAFGVFFDREGQTVIRYPRVGIQIEDLARIPLIITIASGEEKAEVVEAFFKMSHTDGYLVCDEALANMVLSGETQ